MSDATQLRDGNRITRKHWNNHEKLDVSRKNNLKKSKSLSDLEEADVRILDKRVRAVTVDVTEEVINDEAEESRDHGVQEKLVESEKNYMEEAEKQKKEEIFNEDAEAEFRKLIEPDFIERFNVTYEQFIEHCGAAAIARKRLKKLYPSQWEKAQVINDDENENIQEEEEMRGAKQKKGNVRRI